MSDAYPTPGLINVLSKRSVPETMDRLIEAVQSKGMTVFARIDQSAAASVGLSLRPMQLLLFGDPKTGTPLMQSFPSLAIDLPLKALVWEGPDDRVWVSYNSPAYLKERHGLPEVPFQAVAHLIDQALA